jgi:hypothetical protein
MMKTMLKKSEDPEWMILSMMYNTANGNSADIAIANGIQNKTFSDTMRRFRKVV